MYKPKSQIGLNDNQDPQPRYEPNPIPNHEIFVIKFLKITHI